MLPWYKIARTGNNFRGHAPLIITERACNGSRCQDTLLLLVRAKCVEISVYSGVIRTSCSNVGEKVAIRDIDVGRGFPGSMEGWTRKTVMFCTPLRAYGSWKLQAAMGVAVEISLIVQ